MVDVLLIPAKYTGEVVIPENIIEKLPDKLILFASVQFLNNLEDVAAQLEAKGKKTATYRSRNFLYEGLITDKGQLLGCNMEDFNARNVEFDAFLYIGDGLFHPKALLVNNEKDIYCYDPKIGKLNVLEKSLHKEYHKKKKGSVIKFLSSKNIGILITTKIGQGTPKRAYMLKENILKRWPEKRVYMFYANEINFQELENYNFIDCYVNGACSRIGHDDTIRTEKPIVNIADAERSMSDL
jgi:2-(3-amino-3-carboxypropyl)histidine synthase